jgi:outer membrane receptor protein involved in Fe transport
LAAAPGTQLFDLLRVEVLKGPQGTLYGRNTTGGAINYITQKPELQAGAYNGAFEVGYGNYNRFEVQGASDITLMDGVLGARVAVFHSSRDGYIKNVGTAGPSTFASDNTTDGRIILVYRPNIHFDATLGVYVNDFSGSIGGPIDYGIYANDTILAPPPNGYSRQGLTPYEDALNFFPGNKANSTDVGLTMNATFGDLKFTSITSFEHSTAQIDNDCDGSPLSVCADANALRSKQVSQDVRVQYTANRFHLTAGASYGWDEYDEQTNVGFGPGTSYTTNLENDYEQFRTTYGVYFDGTYSFTDQLDLDLGLRDTEDKTTMSKVRSNLLDSVFGSPIGVLIPLQPDVSRSSNGVTGRAILSYKFVPDVMAYASYSRGYRAGAFNGLQFFSPDELNYVGPETTSQEEVGLKATLSHRVTVDVSLFNIDVVNQQVQSEVNIPACASCNPPTPPISYPALAGLKGYSRGADISLGAQILENLVGNVSLTLLDTRYASGASQEVSGASVAGKHFPFAPDVALRAGLDWTAWKEGDQKVTLGVNVGYTGRYWFEPSNGDSEVGAGYILKRGQDPYTTVDARMAYEVGRFRVAVWANNISNQYYIAGATNAEASFGEAQTLSGEPRTFGATLGVRF